MKVYAVMFEDPIKGNEVVCVCRSEALAKEECRSLMDEYLIDYGPDEVSGYYYNEFNVIDGESNND